MWYYEERLLVQTKAEAFHIGATTTVLRLMSILEQQIELRFVRNRPPGAIANQIGAIM